MKIRPCFFLVIPMLFAATSGYSQQREAPYLEKYERGEFPSIDTRLTPEHKRGFPPQLKHLQLNVGAEPEFVDRRARPVAEVRAEARSTALRDTRVTSMLGERFTVIGGREVSPRKNQTGSRRDLVWIEFYSYSSNRAFKVLIEGDEVVEVQRKPEGYQPPESHEEVEAAAEIVRQDRRYKDAVADLTVRGIQTPSENRNRHLYLLFYRADKKSAVFWATVDMTVARVVEAKAIRR